MTQAQAVGFAWALALVVLLGLVTLWRWHRHRAPALREQHLERSRLHQGQVNAIKHWLGEEKVVRTIIDQRVASYELLQAMAERLEGWGAEDVAETVRVLLSNREVRRVIAEHHVRTHPDEESRREIMAALLTWARPEQVA